MRGRPQVRHRQLPVGERRQLLLQRLALKTGFQNKGEIAYFSLRLKKGHGQHGARGVRAPQHAARVLESVREVTPAEDLHSLGTPQKQGLVRVSAFQLH